MNKDVNILTETILTAAKRSIPRGVRKDYKPYWSYNLDNMHKPLSEARTQLEQDPSPENTELHNQLKEDFNETKSKEV